LFIFLDTQYMKFCESLFNFLDTRIYKKIIWKIMPGVQSLKTDKLILSIIQNFEKYLV
jgi:hypothetical protein